MGQVCTRNKRLPAATAHSLNAPLHERGDPFGYFLAERIFLGARKHLARRERQSMVDPFAAIDERGALFLPAAGRLVTAGRRGNVLKSLGQALRSALAPGMADVTSRRRPSAANRKAPPEGATPLLTRRTLRRSNTVHLYNKCHFRPHSGPLWRWTSEAAP